MFIPDTELTHDNIGQQLKAGMAAIDGGQATIDFSQTKHIDSSAVACVLAWKRHADRKGIQIEFKHLPDNLANLTALYGVAEFL